jgi:WD40 repeat protein
VSGIAVSPDGALLLSGSNDYSSRLWNLLTGEVLQVFETSEGIVHRVRFSADGRFFVTSKWDGKTRVRDTEIRQLRALVSNGSNCAALTRDNRLLATASHRSAVSLYRLDLGPPTQEELQRFHTLIQQLDDDDYAIREYVSEEIARIGMVTDPLLKEALDASSPEVRMRARLLLMRIMSPEPLAELTGHRGNSEVVCFSPDDKLLATGCRGGDLKIWSVPELTERISFTAPAAE